SPRAGDVVDRQRGGDQRTGGHGACGDEHRGGKHRRAAAAELGPHVGRCRGQRGCRRGRRRRGCNCHQPPVPTSSRSSRGRSERTSGRTSKLCGGGGDAVVHSSVCPCHGSLPPAVSPSPATARRRTMTAPAAATNATSPSPSRNPPAVAITFAACQLWWVG